MAPHRKRPECAVRGKGLIPIGGIPLYLVRIQCTIYDEPNSSESFPIVKNCVVLNRSVMRGGFGLGTAAGCAQTDECSFHRFG